MSNVAVNGVEKKGKGQGAQVRRPPGPSGGPGTALKSERVQLLLKSLPGWRPVRGMRGIERYRRFPTSEVAQAYVRYVELFAEEVGQGCVVTQTGEHVTVAVASRRHNGGQGVNRSVVDFARRLG